MWVLTPSGVWAATTAAANTSANRTHITLFTVQASNGGTVAWDFLLLFPGRLLRRASRAKRVGQPVIAFVARVLVQEAVDLVPGHLDRPWPCPRVGIGDGELIVDRLRVDSPEPFDEHHVLGRVAESGAPRLVGEIGGLDDERVAVPAAA